MEGGQGSPRDRTYTLASRDSKTTAQGRSGRDEKGEYANVLITTRPRGVHMHVACVTDALTSGLSHLLSFRFLHGSSTRLVLHTSREEKKNRAHATAKRWGSWYSYRKTLVITTDWDIMRCTYIYGLRFHYDNVKKKKMIWRVLPTLGGDIISVY